MKFNNILFNPINLLRQKDLVFPMLHWLHYRISKKITFIAPPQNPFQQKKINDNTIDIIVYEEICQALKKKTSLMMGRYGSTECQAMRSVLLAKTKIQDYIDEAYDELCIYSGFFQKQVKNPTKNDKKKLLEKFMDIMINATKDCDIFGTWNGALAFEEYFIGRYGKKDALLTNMGFFGPNIYQEIPFTYALKNTKVLVVHPFSQTIQDQYRHHDKLFANKKVLPHFCLKTFKAVQTLHQEDDERFQDWFEALEWMNDKISEIDFDIALIGCGAYGFPLASRIKNMGKIAIHCGGMLQLLFGIKGKRWETEQPWVGESLFNDYWIYPNRGETIKDPNKIEGGCYW